MKPINLLLTLSFIVVIGSAVVFGYLYVSRDPALSYWGSELYGNGYWLHPSNTNIAKLEVSQIFDGELTYLNLNSNPIQATIRKSATEFSNVELPIMIREGWASLGTDLGEGAYQFAPSSSEAIAAFLAESAETQEGNMYLCITSNYDEPSEKYICELRVWK